MRAVFFLLLAAPAWMAGMPDKRQEAVALIEKARALSDIEVEGAPPFRLRAQVRLLRLTEGPVEGTFLLDWNSPKQRRQVLHLPGYSKEAGIQGDIHWSVNSLDFTPYLIFQVDQALRFRLTLSNASKRKFSKPREKILNADHARCIEGDVENLQELCFDSETGYLLRWVDRASNASYELSDYAPFASRMFPRTIRVLQGNDPILEVKVENLIPETNPEATLFAPPPGAITTRDGDCQKVESPRRLNGPEPQYPESARRHRLSGVVRLYTEIGTDGAVRGLTVVRSISPELDAAALDAVSRWRYSPLLCNGSPSRVLKNSLFGTTHAYCFARSS